MWTLGSWQGKCVCDVAIRVERVLVDLAVLRVPAQVLESEPRCVKRSPDAADVVAEDFDLGKDGGADDEQRQGEVGVELRHQTVLPPDVVLVHIDLGGEEVKF